MICIPHRVPECPQCKKGLTMAGKCEHGLTTGECMVCASPKYGEPTDPVSARLSQKKAEWKQQQASDLHLANCISWGVCPNCAGDLRWQARGIFGCCKHRVCSNCEQAFEMPDFGI